MHAFQLSVPRPQLGVGRVCSCHLIKPSHVAVLCPASLCCAAAGAGHRLLEVVNLLRKRPSLKQTGLLWRLQASLHETVEEQERLRG